MNYLIETTYQCPVWRQKVYEANTVEEACQMAIEDEDWSEAERDEETSDASYVTGIWPSTSDEGQPITVPRQFDDPVRLAAFALVNFVDEMRVRFATLQLEPIAFATALVNFLKQQFSDLDWIADRIRPNG